MSELLEIYGGAGAIVLGISGLLWKYFQKYEFKSNYDKDAPIDIIVQNWENPGVDYPQDSEFGDNYNRFKFSKNITGNLVTNIPKGHGDVYMYMTVDQKPQWEYNNDFHYLRINIQNVTPNTFVEFQHKYWSIDYKDNCGHRNTRQRIRDNGEHIFKTKSLLGDKVKLEQLGIYISARDYAINNIIINEVYYGEEWSFMKTPCCGKDDTILYHAKRTE